MVTKPDIGQNPWWSTNNDALDEIEALALDAGTVAAAAATDAETRFKNLAYVEDVANAGSALNVNLFSSLSSLTFAVPPTDHSVLLRWGGAFQVTVAGTGSISLGPCDVTNGASPSAYTGFSTVAGTLPAGGYAAYQQLPGEIDVGPSATWRIFRLYAFLGRDSALTAVWRPSVDGSVKTWMRAVQT